MSKPFSRLEQNVYERGYRVTDCGDVVSPKGRKLTPRTDCGYLRFSGGNGNKVSVHRLAAFQIHGEAIYTPGTEVRHLDGNPLNNCPSNLAIGTSHENKMDRPASVRMALAVNASRYRVEYDHAEVAEFYKQHGWAATIARFGMSKGTLYPILRKFQVLQMEDLQHG